MEIKVTVNGQEHVWEVEPDAILLDVLRDHGYVSVKRGCEEGVCGACSILVDGKRHNSCIMFAGQAHEMHITTVEGLGTIKRPHPIQEAFVQAGAVQCGFCTPGMILATKELLDKHENPTDEQIRSALDGNLCRCTGYVKILDAVELAAQMVKKQKTSSAPRASVAKARRNNKFPGPRASRRPDGKARGGPIH